MRICAVVGRIRHPLLQLEIGHVRDRYATSICPGTLTSAWHGVWQAGYVDEARRYETLAREAAPWVEDRRDYETQGAPANHAPATAPTKKNVRTPRGPSKSH
jgi:hypothetical protein